MTHVMPVSLTVEVVAQSGLWELDLDELGVGTVLAAADTAPGNILDLSCDLVEVSWAQGTANDTPDQLVPLPEAGTLTAQVLDPTDRILPPGSPAYAGVRPGRRIWLHCATTGTVLWSGQVERVVLPSPSDPLRTTGIEAVDTVVRLARQETSTVPRPRERASARASWLLATWFPDLDVRVDPSAFDVGPTDGRSSPLTVLQDAVRAETGWLRVDRDGGVTFRASSWEPSPTWTMPMCATARPEGITADLMMLRNRWEVRHAGAADADPWMVAEEQASVAAYGRWTQRLTDHPVPDQTCAARIAQVGAAVWGQPGQHVAGLAVNVAAARHAPALPVLLDAVRAVSIGDVVEFTSRGLQARARVTGWTWTWTGAGGLSGMLAVTREILTTVMMRWQLGVAGLSDLGETTILN